ncbi:hypothetical protein ACT453_58160, partial [Bacillus sp. D-CC]
HINFAGVKDLHYRANIMQMFQGVHRNPLGTLPTFNQKYQQSGINELDLVKFLSPDRLLLLEKMLEGFPGCT